MNKTERTIAGGLVIIIDGLDGVGKTTQIRLAEAALKHKNYLVKSVHNLGGTRVGDDLKQIYLGTVARPPMTNLYLALAIQAALIDELARLRRTGAIVLIDRSPVSMATYLGYGGDLDQALVWHYCDENMKEYDPDLVIIYDLPVDQALARGKSAHSPDDYFSSKPRAYFDQVNQGYQEAAKRYRAELIDARPPVGQIHKSTMALIESRLTSNA